MSVYIASDGSRWEIERNVMGYWDGTDENYEPGNFFATGPTRDECIYAIEAQVCERLERADECL